MTVAEMVEKDDATYGGLPEAVDMSEDGGGLPEGEPPARPVDAAARQSATLVESGLKMVLEEEKQAHVATQVELSQVTKQLAAAIADVMVAEGDAAKMQATLAVAKASLAKEVAAHELTRKAIEADHTLIDTITAQRAIFEAAAAKTSAGSAETVAAAVAVAEQAKAEARAAIHVEALQQRELAMGAQDAKLAEQAAQIDHLSSMKATAPAEPLAACANRSKLTEATQPWAPGTLVDIESEDGWELADATILGLRESGEASELRVVFKDSGAVDMHRSGNAPNIMNDVVANKTEEIERLRAKLDNLEEMVLTDDGTAALTTWYGLMDTILTSKELQVTADERWT